MRKQEIEQITLESVHGEILARIENTNPTQEEIDAEFQIYIRELLNSRIDELHSKFEKTQFAQGLYNLGHSVKNFKTFLYKLILEDSVILDELQIELNRMQTEIDANAYLENRKLEYSKIDIMLMEAIAEKEAGRPEKMAQYLAIREQIKINNPAP